MTRRRAALPLTLTRVPGLGIAGRDEQGEGWMGLDATKSTIACVACGNRIEYGYAPLRNTTKRAHCVKCVAFVESEGARW